MFKEVNEGTQEPTDVDDPDDDPDDDPVDDGDCSNDDYWFIWIIIYQ